MPTDGRPRAPPSSSAAAARLPRKQRFEGGAVRIRREGSRVILEPVEEGRDGLDRLEGTLARVAAIPLAACPFEAADARRAAAPRAKRVAAGTPIAPLDTLIAGPALARGRTVVTAPVSAFWRVPDLRVENGSAG